jgi:Putative adhesin
MQNRKYLTSLAIITILAEVVYGAGEVRKEFRYTVGPKASISVINEYGPISIKPSPGNQVLVTAILGSDQVEVDQSQSGDRVSILSHLKPGADRNTGWVEYQVQVPSDASVTIHSNTGPLSAEHLRGDLTMEGAAAPMQVRDIRDAHVHVRTMDGPVTLTNVLNGHVEITSVSGDVNLNGVTGALVEVNSNSGRIHYDGDFGGGGQYRLMSNTGDIEAFAPESASIDVSARSVHGQVDNDFRLIPEHTNFVVRAGSAFAGTIGKAASSVKLHSFSGKIHLKIRPSAAK